MINRSLTLGISGLIRGPIFIQKHFLFLDFTMEQSKALEVSFYSKSLLVFVTSNNSTNLTSEYITIYELTVFLDHRSCVTVTVTLDTT